MERSRTKYRASLSWMKDVSQSLDPDTYSQLEKFKKVQGKVKATKSLFDRYKVDTLEKVDLLAAARCNMFSHALSQYHNGLLKFASTSAAAFQAIAEVCAEHQHFEWNVVKELSELRPTDVPAQQQTEQPESDDKLLNFDEFDAPAEVEKSNEMVPEPPTQAEDTSTSSSYLPSQLLLSEGQSFFSNPPDKTALPSKSSDTVEKEKSAWLDLISELDPLSNPDSVGQTATLEPFGDC